MHNKSHHFGTENIKKSYFVGLKSIILRKMQKYAEREVYWLRKVVILPPLPPKKSKYYTKMFVISLAKHKMYKYLDKKIVIGFLQGKKFTWEKWLWSHHSHCYCTKMSFQSKNTPWRKETNNQTLNYECLVFICSGSVEASVVAKCNPCASSPCHNRGLCQGSHSHSQPYTCTCKDGFTVIIPQPPSPILPNSTIKKMFRSCHLPPWTRK